MKKWWIFVLWILILASLWSCAPVVAQSGTSLQATPVMSTAVGYPGPSLVPTGYPAGQPTATSGGTPTAYPAPGGGREVTLEQNGQKVSLHVGETFLLKLGELYQWNIEIDRPEVVSRVPNIAVIRGAQGVYKANQPGTATLTADGDPLCRQTKPACGMPSRRFTIQVEVLQ